VNEIQWSFNSECIQSNDDLQGSELLIHYTATIWITVLQHSKYPITSTGICIDDSQRVSYFLKLSVEHVRKLIWFILSALSSISTFVLLVSAVLLR